MGLVLREVQVLLYFSGHLKGNLKPDIPGVTLCRSCNDLIIVTKLPRDADSVLLCTVITSTVVITSTAPGFEILAFDGHGQGTTAESISADSCFLQPLINFVTNLIGTQEEDSLNHIVQERI